MICVIQSLFTNKILSMFLCMGLGHRIGSSSRLRRVMNGEQATVGQFPSMVYIEAGESQCGGVILNDRWILSAAHSFEEK